MRRDDFPKTKLASLHAHKYRCIYHYSQRFLYDMYIYVTMTQPCSIARRDSITLYTCIDLTIHYIYIYCRKFKSTKSILNLYYTYNAIKWERGVRTFISHAATKSCLLPSLYPRHAEPT